MASYSKSPWRLEAKGPGWYIIDAENKNVAVLNATREDAILMAQAPSLLETLEALFNDLDCRALRRYLTKNVVMNAREAIANAKARNLLGNAELGDKFEAVVPVDVCDDVVWEPGTVVEVTHVYDDDGGYDLEDEEGFSGSFAPSDLFGDHRWFKPYQKPSEDKGE